MTFEAGDVVLVPFPFTDLTASKTRPALVISRGSYNEGSRDVVLLGMTSNLTNAAHSILVDDGDLSDGTLAATSRVKVDKIVSLEQRLVRKTVASLDPATLQRVMRELLSLHPDVG